MNKEQLQELLYQSLETEKGGVQIYSAAVRCAVNEELREEWEEYLEQTRHHVEVLEQVFQEFGLDTQQETPGREVVRKLGTSLVQAISMASSKGDPEAAELVAAECVVLAETKDHMNWELLSKAAEKLTGPEKKALEKACEEVEDEEDEHLYHTTGWARELWIKSLGLKAVLPPPEEKKDVKTAIGAARAKASRNKMASRQKSV
jgi:ferritin-like metal-binding protein YciE